MALGLTAVLIGLVIVRVAYHSSYLADVPFALATFSDGRIYEEAALDILQAPPWGRRPFYLQGIYAYQLALPMILRPLVSLALLGQLVLASLALWGLFRAMVARWGRREAGLGLALLLAYPGLAFYENKFLTASLAVVTLVAMVMALARVQRRPGPAALVGLGAAAGLAVLARGNMLLAVPGVAVAAVLATRPAGLTRRRTLGWFALGLVLVVSPMALRNGLVTGRATIFPAHGGGTSFYIGNNQHARGVWNTAGGLLSGEVVHEREELAARLGVEADTEAAQARAVGRALYRRAAAEIAEQPGRWLWLELRKLWLTLGNDELSQDYDIAGERELLAPWLGRGLPFGALLAAALAGLVAIQRRRSGDPARAERWRPWAWLLGSQIAAVLAANLLFFTSAQHRLPLVVPLAVLAGPGLAWLGTGWSRRADRRAWGMTAALMVVVLGLCAWPRMRGLDRPSAAHYYNLAITQVRLGEPREAIKTLDRAVALRPEHVVIRLERLTLNRSFGNLDDADVDLAYFERLPQAPGWVQARVIDERRRVKALREVIPPELTRSRRQGP